jgi:predicted Zn-ribbon and HTH transcriptional regulator
MATEIKIEIKDCSECPFFKEERVYTEDSFEMPFDWYCNKAHGKKIAGYVEWHDKIAIPDWCPCKTNTYSHPKKIKK